MLFLPLLVKKLSISLIHDFNLEFSPPNSSNVIVANGNTRNEIVYLHNCISDNYQLLSILKIPCVTHTLIRPIDFTTQLTDDFKNNVWNIQTEYYVI